MKKSKFGEAQYEAHITLLGNVDKKNELLLNVLKTLGMKVVDLVNIEKEGLQSEEFDVITTMHSPNLKDILGQTVLAVRTLQNMNFNVVRYKVESTIVDSKFDDKYKLLPK